MKIRSGFVSNSSSDSHIIRHDTIKPEEDGFNIGCCGTWVFITSQHKEKLKEGKMLIFSCDSCGINWHVKAINPLDRILKETT